MQRESKSIKRANGKGRMYPNEQKDKKKESRCTKVFVNQSAIVLAVSSVWVFQKTISKDCCCWHSIQKIVISFTYLKPNNKSHITFYYIWQWKSMMNEITLLVNEITQSDADNFQYLIFGGKLDYFKDCLNFYLKIFLKKNKKSFFCLRFVIPLNKSLKHLLRKLRAAFCAFWLSKRKKILFCFCCCYCAKV
jgi:hypothetical protein